MIERELETTEDDDDEDEPPLAVSFFSSPGDAVTDERVCSSINNMMTKARGGGIAESMRKRMSLERAVEAEPTNETEREDTMATKKKEKEEERPPAKPGVTLEAVRTAAVALHGELGRRPTSREVFDRIGPNVGRNTANVHMTMKRLDARGELPGEPLKLRSGPARTATPEARAKKVKSPRPAHRVVNGGGHTTSRGPLVLSRDSGSLPLRADIAAKVDSDPALAAIVRRRNELADKVAQLTHVIENW